jgi:hypothetical protein
MAGFAAGTYQLAVALAGDHGEENRWLTFRIMGPEP